MSRVVVIMGVSGSGKTTIAERVAGALGWMFQEGDKLHPAANVAKMAAGHALTDEDRWPWLDNIAQWIEARLHAGTNGVITCSALKRSYRERIGNGKPGVQIVYLHGDRATLDAHVHGRHHEFMPPALLDSQLETLEEPLPEEHVIEVDVGGSVEHTVTLVLQSLAPFT
jgi:carbohydrate kinase (thermoresistant glucokinase family)